MFFWSWFVGLSQPRAATIPQRVCEDGHDKEIECSMESRNFLQPRGLTVSLLLRQRFLV